MQAIKPFLFLVLFLVVTSSSLQAQSAKKIALQKQYNSILLEIKQLQSSIDKTKQQQNLGLKEVAIINTKIDKRTKLISNIEVQKKEIESELTQKLSDVENINVEIDILKKEYSKLILWLNKNHNAANKLAFVLEANGFKEAYHRIRYIKKYGDYRAKQSTYLSNQIDRIMEKITALNVVKTEKVNIIQANKHQQNELVEERKERDVMVQKLSKEIDGLKTQVRTKNQQASAINARIKSIIEQEIKKQREIFLAETKAKRAKDRKNNPENANESDEVTRADIEKSPEGILSNSFNLTKGSMPWPVSSGVITSKFGRQPHPADPELFIDNNGIDIKTNTNADVKSIYKGKVVRIFDMPTYQTCVMVKHGDFFTVYSHLKSVSVSEGTEVSSGHTLGKSCFDEGHGYSLVNLQIWHYQNKQNPQVWLMSR
jgi:murein hydrolase activator